MLNTMHIAIAPVSTDINFVEWITTIKPDTVIIGLVNISIAIIIYYLVNKKQTKKTFRLHSLLDDIKDMREILDKLGTWMLQKNNINIQEYITLIEMSIKIIGEYKEADQRIITTMEKNIEIIDIHWENEKSTLADIARKDIGINILELKSKIIHTAH